MYRPELKLNIKEIGDKKPLPTVEEFTKGVDRAIFDLQQGSLIRARYVLVNRDGYTLAVQSRAFRFEHETFGVASGPTRTICGIELIYAPDLKELFVVVGNERW